MYKYSINFWMHAMQKLTIFLINFCSLFYNGYCIFSLLNALSFVLSTWDFKCRSLSPNLSSPFSFVRETAESHENVIAFPSSSPLAFQSSFSSSCLRKIVAGLRWSQRFTSLEELIAPRTEKFMASFHLTLSYRWDTTIIAGIGRYLEYRKVANGLSPLTWCKEEFARKVFTLFSNLPFIFLHESKHESCWDVRLTHQDF